MLNFMRTQGMKFGFHLRFDDQNNTQVSISSCSMRVKEVAYVTVFLFPLSYWQLMAHHASAHGVRATFM